MKIPQSMRDFQGNGNLHPSTKNVEFNFKRADAPTITKSMHIALDNLKLDSLVIVYPGERRYTLTKGVEVVPLAEVVNAK